MKKLFSTLIALLMVVGSFASEADTISCKSKISDVTVFFSGAEITRNVQVNVPKGRHFLLLEGLPVEIEQKSIVATSPDTTTILSVKKFNTTKSGKSSEAEKALEKKINEAEFAIKKIKSQLNIYDLEYNIIMENSDLSSGSENLTAEEIRAAADFYRQRLSEITNLRFDLNAQLEEKEENLKALYRKLNIIAGEKALPTATIAIELECLSAINSSMTVKYIVASAGWNPQYDFRVENTDQPLAVVYRTVVYQSTGEDWKEVNLTLSNGNPTLTGEAPKLKKWYIDRAKPTQKTTEIREGDGTIKGQVTDSETGEPIPFTSVVVYEGSRQMGGASTDFDGYYTIRPVKSGRYNLKATTVGYQPQQFNQVVVNADKIIYQDFYLTASAVNLEAVEIKEYSMPLISKDKTMSGGTMTSEEIAKMPAKSNSAVATTVGGVYSRDGNSSYSTRGLISEEDYITNNLEKVIGHTEYHIDMPYTIIADGSDHNIRIKEAKVGVDYKYRSVPRFDENVFLTAQITNRKSLNLLSGYGNIYYEGTFTGSSYINTRETSDTLELSLGRNPGIIVTREPVKEDLTSRVIGNKVKETVAYEITVRNTTGAAAMVVVEDQYPLTSHSSTVEVELLESDGAVINTETGFMKWNLYLKPDEEKSVKFSFSVKYPSYKKMHF